MYLQTLTRLPQATVAVLMVEFDIVRPAIQTHGRLYRDQCLSATYARSMQDRVLKALVDQHISCFRDK